MNQILKNCFFVFILMLIYSCKNFADKSDFVGIYGLDTIQSRFFVSEKTESILRSTKFVFLKNGTFYITNTIPFAGAVPQKGTWGVYSDGEICSIYLYGNKGKYEIIGGSPQGFSVDATLVDSTREEWIFDLIFTKEFPLIN